MDEFLKPNANFIRLVEDWEKYGSLTIGFDFDGTVHDYHKKGHTYHMTIELLKELHKLGCKLVCWTAYEDLVYVEEYLEKIGIPLCSINKGGISLPWTTVKPFFSALLDDRAGLESAFRDLSLLVWYIKKKKT